MQRSRLFFFGAMLVFVSLASSVPVTAMDYPSLTPLPNHGGSFTAAYSGSFQYRGCSPPDGQGQFAFQGLGSASFISSSSQAGSLVGNVYLGCKWSGTATIESARYPRNRIYFSLVGERLGFRYEPPCDAVIDFTVTGGTRRFVAATGSGKMRFSCNNNGTYTDQWSGTISF